MFNSRFKSGFIIALIIVVVIGMMEILYIRDPLFIRNINNNLIDSAFLYRGKTPVDSRIAIVDVDERSLRALGQWPWSRHKIARVLQNLTDAGAAIIGLDMVFAERDGSSPARIAADLNMSAAALPDYDRILAKTLASTPVITGFTFDFDRVLPNPPPQNSTIYIQRGRGDREALPVARGVVTNIPLLQQSSYSSGSFNTVPDSDGIVRYVPLLISYDDAIYPALSFEMVRTLLGAKKVEIRYDPNGVAQIDMGGIEIPTNAQGKLFVNYHGGAHTYPYLSAVDIYRGTFDRSAVAGKIILLGTSAAGLLDLRATPFDSVYPGVEVHANAIDNLINGDMIAANSSIDAVVTMGAIALSVVVTALILQFASPLLSFGLILSFLMAGATLYYRMLFEAHLLLNFAYPLLATLVSVFLFTFLKIYAENRQKEMIASKFARKVSPQVAAQLLKESRDIFTTSEEEITIFFSDIRNFTTISEAFESPKILIEYLNMYMSPMSEIIISERGTIDKYIGDAIMAYWNAPLRVEKHADRALTAAIRQIEALKKLNRTLQEKDFPPIDIGIGLHTGKAIVGEMGSEGRSDYTVIGDTINLGSRIEGLCKTYGAKILISESTRAQLQERYRMREVDIVQVKGKNRAITIHEVVGFGTFEAVEAARQKRYMHARRLYKAARFKEAYALFAALYEEDPQTLYALYMERCEVYQTRGIKEFDGIHRFTTK